MPRKVIIQTAIYVFFVFFQLVQPIERAETEYYAYYSERLTFEKAREFCQNGFPKGDLLTIENESQKQIMIRFFTDNGHAFTGERKLI